MAICAESSSLSSGSGTKVWFAHGLILSAAVVAAAGAYFLRLSKGFRSRVIGIIPARYASSRFEGKPLVPIIGKPMIQLWQLMMRELQNAAEHLELMSS